MFYSAGDFQTASSLINSSPNQAAKSMQMDQASASVHVCECVAFARLMLSQLLRMKEFCMAARCRRVSILEYFGEMQPVDCTGCDVCTAAASAVADGIEKHDFTADFKTVLELLTGISKTLTVNQTISVLRGQKDAQKYNSAAFGIGSSRSGKWWEHVCNVMVSSQLLQMQAKSYVAPNGRTLSFTVICPTAAGAAFVRSISGGCQPCALLPLPASLRTTPFRSSVAAARGPTVTDDFLEHSSPQDQQLFASLKAKRAELATVHNCPVTEVAFDGVLRGITLHKPATLPQAIHSPYIAIYRTTNYALNNPLSSPLVVSWEIPTKSLRNTGSSGAASCSTCAAATPSTRPLAPCPNRSEELLAPLITQNLT